MSSRRTKHIIALVIFLLIGGCATMAYSQSNNKVQLNFDGRGYASLNSASPGAPMIIGGRQWDVIDLEVNITQTPPCNRVQIGFLSFTPAGARIGNAGNDISSMEVRAGQSYTTFIRHTDFSKAGTIHLWLQCDFFAGPYPSPLPPLYD
ncbi:hypothetical protein JL100_033060 (plasmid) [Skermanella mucosa]|uniref:hypothetical protein n=1 Tax=Skermanella mucosa TaxID=1789672 RepID=UPI00192B7E5C|nr:hypothetical protein [Skermanella mucosa]UEM24446.1 hypothetical protein JL100_033060 [Skermanella mucosa]